MVSLFYFLFPKHKTMFKTKLSHNENGGYSNFKIILTLYPLSGIAHEEGERADQLKICFPLLLKNHQLSKHPLDPIGEKEIPFYFLRFHGKKHLLTTGQRD